MSIFFPEKLAYKAVDKSRAQEGDKVAADREEDDGAVKVEHGGGATGHGEAIANDSAEVAVAGRELVLHKRLEEERGLDGGPDDDKDDLYSDRRPRALAGSR